MPLRARARASQIRRTFGADVDNAEASRLAAEYVARPLCDGVVLRRFMLRGWADFAGWRVEQRSTPAVDALRASDESFILATGHFSRQAFMPLYNPEVVSQKRRFATGAARLSGMTGRPIVVCIPYLVDDEAIVLDWTRVIRPACAGDERSDMRLTDLIVDDIEKAIGRRPWQYLLDYLGERSWDLWTEHWVSS